MSTLEEQVDVDVPVQVVWDHLHRVDEYPRFVGGVLHAHPHGTHRCHLDVEIDGSAQEVETEITDRGRGRLMSWETLSGPHLKGTFALRPLDPEHTQVQIRVEYDPEAVKEVFGGPKGFAQASAIEHTVRADLESFKHLVEEGERPATAPGGTYRGQGVGRISNPGSPSGSSS